MKPPFAPIGGVGANSCFILGVIGCPHMGWPGPWDAGLRCLVAYTDLGLAGRMQKAAPSLARGKRNPFPFLHGLARTGHAAARRGHKNWLSRCKVGNAGKVRVTSSLRANSCHLPLQSAPSHTNLSFISPSPSSRMHRHEPLFPLSPSSLVVCEQVICTVAFFPFSFSAVLPSLNLAVP